MTLRHPLNQVSIPCVSDTSSQTQRLWSDEGEEDNLPSFRSRIPPPPSASFIAGSSANSVSSVHVARLLQCRRMMSVSATRAGEGCRQLFTAI